MLRKAFILKSIVSGRSQWFSGLFGAMVVCGFLMSVMTGAVFSQGTTMSQRSPLKIDPREGKLNLTVSFTAGADRMGSPIVDELYYSSAVWDMDYQVIQGQIQTYYRTSTNYNKATAGWNSSLDAPTIGYDSETYDFQGYNAGACVAEGNSCPPPQTLFYMKKKIVSIPGVGTHDLYKDEVPYTFNPQASYRDDTGIFYSVDGSRIKYDADTRTLYLPNGSRYLFDTQGRATTYIDRNGNQRTYNATGRSWTDTLGRVYNNPVTNGFSIPTAPTDQTYGVPGFGGGTINYVLQWKRLQDALNDPSQQLKYTGDIQCGNSNGNVALPAGESLFQSSQPTTACADTDELTHTTAVRFNPIVLAAVILPNGAKYTFKYSLYGDIEKVEMPEGGYERYEYVTSSKLLYPQYCSNPYDKILYRQVIKRIVSPSGQGGDEQTTFIQTNNADQNGFTLADGTSRFATTHYVGGNEVCFSVTSQPYTPFGFVDIRKSLRTVKETQTSSGAAAGYQMLRRTLTDTSVISKTYPRTHTDTRPSTYTTTRDPRVEGEIGIVFEPNDAKALVSLVKYEYESNIDTPTFTHLNVTRVKTYDYVTVDRSIAETGDYATLVSYFSNQLPYRTQETDYLHDAGYDARHIIGMPSATRVKDKNGVIVAQSEIKYDEAGYPILGYGAATNWVDPQTNYRGNPTTTKSWTNVAADQFVETHAQYDNFGNPRKSWDAKGNFSTTDYSSTYAYAYPTSVTTPVPDASGANGSSQAFTTSSVYDFNTGLPTSATDANGQTSVIEYNDALLRPTKVTAPNGQQNITEYGAGTSAATRFVKVRTQIDATNWKEGYSWYDGLGRTVKSQSVASTGDVFTETEYDQMGRAKRSSNPHRANETIYWTENTYDDLGRVTKVKTPDNAEVNTAYLLGTGTTVGTVVTVTDQASKQRRSITNGLGQLTRVDEPDTATNSLGTIDSPAQPTAYAYDALDNLKTVTQTGTTQAQCGAGTYPCTQTRTFDYDSLSRLKSAANPESGTVQYGYDNNGNLLTKFDARTITTTYAYDNLNRVKSRSYNDGVTPAVSYFYDNLTNARGKLIKVSSSVSTTEYTGFDLMGRVTGHQQTTDGTTYTTAYSYNLSGGMLTETYPSTRVVKNVLDNNGDLSIVQSKKNFFAGYFDYAQHFTFTAAGAVSSMQLGNGKWESTQFNSRLQPTQIALGTLQNGTDNLKLNFSYNSASSTTDNNGNVTSQQITVPQIETNAAFTATQNYTYDSLNRLKQATETIPGQTGWQQTFTYDRFGNRNFDEANTTTLPKNCGGTTVCAGDVPIYDPVVNTSNNRLNGYSYDNAGNTTINASSQTFTYDAENKQTKVQSGSTVLGEYSYDGDGKRVKKVATISGVQETTIFVYDASGKMVAEYSTNPASVANAKVSYLTSDHLGSPRITTDAGGGVTSRRDFMPFGEEILRAGYGADTVRQKFTSYERDNESELDYAKARMYGYGYGRFTSPDPHNVVFEKQLEKDTDKGNRQFSNYISMPEQWNKYVYSINNPLKFVDPDGREIRLSSSLTEKERSEILYYLQKLTRDKLNWKTDSKGNFNIIITKTGGGGNDAGTRLIRRLDGYKSVITITQGSGGNQTDVDNTTNGSNGTGSNSTVTFNPNASPKIGTLDENTGVSRSQDRPSWIGLAHELIHADQVARGTELTGTGTYSYRDTTGVVRTARENRYELATVGIGGLNNRMDITENDIRKEQGLRLRSEY